MAGMNWRRVALGNRRQLNIAEEAERLERDRAARWLRSREGREAAREFARTIISRHSDAKIEERPAGGTFRSNTRQDRIPVPQNAALETGGRTSRRREVLQEPRIVGHPIQQLPQGVTWGDEWPDDALGASIDPFAEPPGPSQ